MIGAKNGLGFYRLLFVGWLFWMGTLGAPAMLGQDTEETSKIKTFGLSNGLEVQTRHLANTGAVHARLVFSWTEGTKRAPLGTAWTMFKALPALGCNGVGRDAFQSHKDQAGVLSSVSVGRGWIAWDFYSDPANADLMIQSLADESLRPLWPGGEQLSGLLKRIWEERHFLDSRDEAAHAFKVAAKDSREAQLPDTPIGHDQFISLWAANVWRPTRAVLRVSGDLESISLQRLVNQHFGPWAGTSPSSADEEEARPKTPSQFPKPGDPINIDSALPAVWAAVGGSASVSEEKKIKALLPWLAKVGLPPSDAIIASWEASPEGSWIMAMGRAGRPLDELRSHFLALLGQLATEETIGTALKALADSEAASALRPAKAFDAFETASALGERDQQDLLKTLESVQWDWLTMQQWK